VRAEARSGEEKGAGEIKRAKSVGVADRRRERASERARARGRGADGEEVKECREERFRAKGDKAK